MCVLQPSQNSYWFVSPAHVQHLRGEAFIGGIGLVGRWLARRRQLRALTDLDDRLLADVGITRDAAKREIARAFWLTYACRHLK